MKKHTDMTAEGTTQCLFLRGRLPDLNAFAGKRTRWAYTGLKRAVGGEITFQLTRARLRPMGAVRVRCTWREPNRRRDPDNITVGLKFVLDELVKAGTLTNDGWEAIRGIEHRFEVVTAESVGVLIELLGVEETGLGAGLPSNRQRKK